MNVVNVSGTCNTPREARSTRSEMFADARFAAEYEERQQQWEAGIEERTRVFFAKLNEPAEDLAAEQERLFERSRRLMTANSQS